MLEEQLKKLIEEYLLKDRNAITFGHTKMKMKWILPLPGITVTSFEQFQPFFIYFDNTGISFFPLNQEYYAIAKSFVAWQEMVDFKFKKGVLENEIKVQLKNGKIEMKIPKAKAMNAWVKENNNYLAENNFFSSTTSQS